MFKLVHDFEGGRSVLCTDGKFHTETVVGKTIAGRRIVAKLYKNPTRGLAMWNAAMSDYARAVEA